MRYRDHEKEVRRLLVEHHAEKAALHRQIDGLKETIEALRLRASIAEQKAVDAEERWRNAPIEEAMPV